MLFGKVCCPQVQSGHDCFLNPDVGCGATSSSCEAEADLAQAAPGLLVVRVEACEAEIPEKVGLGVVNVTNTVLKFKRSPVFSIGIALSQGL